MKKFFLSIVAALLAVPTFAQIGSGGFSVSETSVYYGVRLGMNISTITGKYIDADSKVGMTLGGVLGLRVSETTPVFLESGLYYSGRGAKDLNLNYLELPILIKYGIQATDNIALLPFIGPYFAQAISGKTKINGVKVGTFDEKKWMGLNRFNMGFKLGCGAEYNKLYLELGYQFGVNNISKADEIDGIHSNAFFANFGVNF